MEVTSSEAFDKIGEAEKLCARFPEMTVTHIDKISHVYSLAKREGNDGRGRYYDELNARGYITRTDAEKRFHVLSGKIAELEFQRQCETNRGYRTIRGVSLLAGKPDNGIDYIYEYDIKNENGQVTGIKRVRAQIKYRHGSSFSIKANDIKQCVDNELLLIIIRCDDFYANYRPRNTKDPDYISWREPPLPPSKSYYWDIYKLEAAKAVQDGKMSFSFNDRNYVALL